MRIGAVFVLALLSGCGGAKRERQNELIAIGIAYHVWDYENIKADKDLAGPADLEPYLLKLKPTSTIDLPDVNLPQAYQRLKDGDYVFLWHADLLVSQIATGVSTTEIVLAYEKDVPEKGGHVLFVDGHVADVTAAAFKDAPKAKLRQKEGGKP